MGDDYEQLFVDVESRAGRDATWSGQVSRAYDEWRLSERELIAFLRLSLRFSRSGFDALWEEAGRAPAGEDCTERVDEFEASTDGLWSSQYEWLLLNLVLREAVTLYEVYLEKALHEVADFKVGQTVVGERSPDPKDRDDAFRTLLGVEPYPREVAEIFALRNLLTHRRGELRTENLRAQYGGRSEGGFPRYSLPLDVPGVVAHMDTLATAARQVDVVVHRFAWGTRSIPDEERQAIIQAAPWLFGVRREKQDD